MGILTWHTEGWRKKNECRKNKKFHSEICNGLTAFWLNWNAQNMFWCFLDSTCSKTVFVVVNVREGIKCLSTCSAQPKSQSKQKVNILTNQGPIFRINSNTFSIFFKNGPPSASFSSFQTNITIFTTNKCEKMSIQYTVLGFKPTNFEKWVSSHYH